MIGLKRSPIKDCKDRVIKAKTNLPPEWKEIITSNYPEYNTTTGTILMLNVHKLNTTDITLTGIMERIASGELKLKK